jgi:Tol biopolymer transport system component
MRCSLAPVRGPLAVACAAATALLTGCSPPAAEGPIQPLPPAEGRINPGLGPEARPLSSGPGYKGSPSWSPGGDRVAFIVDGYVVDRTVDGERLTRWTTKDFVATEVEWTADGALTMLGGAEAAEGGPGAVYRTDSEMEGSLGVEEIAGGVLAMTPGPEREDVVLALEAGPDESAVALLRAGRIERLYTGTVPGTVTAASPSPDGERVVLAVRPAGDGGPSELHLFDLRTGRSSRISELGDARSILGAPQWTDHGIYFVAGAMPSPADDGEPLYELYRTAPAQERPEPAPGVGEDFIAGGARVSPRGDRLAVVGRLNPKSPLNLYVLNLRTRGFDAVTTNEDMEIKTGPDDLAWSPAGTSVAIVARGASSGEPEVRAAPADELLDAFYNLYEVPISTQEPPAPEDPR